MNIRKLVENAHKNAMNHGWWDRPPHNINEKLMLIVTEAAEACEDVRAKRLDESTDENGKPVGLPTELADIVIRVADLCGYLDIDLQSAISRKMKYNRSRPYRHGGKTA